MFYLFKIAGIFIATTVADAAPAGQSMLDYDCAYMEGNEFLEAVAAPSPGRVSCLAGAGFIEEARAALRAKNPSQSPALAELLDLISGHNTPAQTLVDWARRGSPEAVFWLLATSHADDQISPDPRLREYAAAYLVSAPDWVKQRYATSFASALIARGDARNAMWLANILSREYEQTPAALNIANFIRGEAYQRNNAPHDAITQYEKITSPHDDPLVIEARLRRVALMWSIGAIRTDEAVTKLEDIDRDWRGGDLGARIRLALSRAYAFSGKLYESFRLLENLSHSAPREIYKKEATTRMKILVQEAFTIRTREYELIALLDMFQRFDRDTLDAQERVLLDISAAHWFASAGFHAHADKILSPYTPAYLAMTGDDIALLAAETLLSVNQKERAAAIASAIERPSLPADAQQRYDLLQAKLGPIELASDEASPDVAIAIAEKAWRQGQWDLYHAIAPTTTYERAASPLRSAIAAYLATGERIGASEMESIDRRIGSALSSPEPTTPHKAADLRKSLAPADAVIEMARALPQSRQQLSALMQESPSTPIKQN